jgi:hypothetical protein
MRRLRVRFTVRTMMVAVAVVAVAVGGGLTVTRLKRLRDEYRQKAEYHAQEMGQWDLSGGVLGLYFFEGRNVYELSPDGRFLRWYPLPTPPVVTPFPGDVPWVEGTNGLPEDDRAKVTRRFLAYRARAVYHAALRRKYERAAASPWLAIDPDPPEPNL